MSNINVALIICSTRTSRKGPQIASWVSSTLKAHLPDNTSLTTVDLADWPLPISPSVVPAGLPKPLLENAYNDVQIDAWSLEVRKYDAFVFLTPQYNWSFTAAAKVAIDHLFFEWVGKPGMVVAYGNRGGGLAAGQLNQVLKGLRMQTREDPLELILKVGGEVDVFTKLWEEEGKPKALLERFNNLLVDVSNPAPASAH